MSIHRAPLPEPKRPFDWKTAILMIAIAVLTFLFWIFVVWVSGLLAYLQAKLTKDILGYLAAGSFIVIYLFVFMTHDKRRGSGHDN